jgi:CBS domain-containing protein
MDDLQRAGAELTVGSVIDHDARLRTVEPSMSIRDVVKLLDETPQSQVPVIDASGQLRGVLAADVVRSVLAEDPAHGLVVAEDLVTPDIPVLSTHDSVQRALELLALQHVEVLPVVSDQGSLAGLLDRRTILRAYRRRIDELRGKNTAT